MTNADNSNEYIRELLTELTRKQDRTQDQISQIGDKILRIEDKILRIEDKILNTQEQLLSNEYLIRDLTNDTARILGHNTIVGDMVLEMRDNQEILQRNFEVHQQNFDTSQQNTQRLIEENQRTTNAALERLEAILLQLIQRNN